MGPYIILTPRVHHRRWNTVTIVPDNNQPTNSSSQRPVSFTGNYLVFHNWTLILAAAVKINLTSNQAADIWTEEFDLQQQFEPLQLLSNEKQITALQQSTFPSLTFWWTLFGVVSEPSLSLSSSDVSSSSSMSGGWEGIIFYICSVSQHTVSAVISVKCDLLMSVVNIVNDCDQMFLDFIPWQSCELRTGRDLLVSVLPYFQVMQYFSSGVDVNECTRGLYSPI